MPASTFTGQFLRKADILGLVSLYIFGRELFEVLLSALNEEESVVVSRDMEGDQLLTVSPSSTSEGRDAKIMLARVTLDKLAGAKITKVGFQICCFEKEVFKKSEN